MSQIVTYLKCEYCETEFKNIYISFGHPDEDFDWKWKCERCEKTNTLHIEAMPMWGFGMLNETFKNKKENLQKQITLINSQLKHSKNYLEKQNLSRELNKYKIELAKLK